MIDPTLQEMDNRIEDLKKQIKDLESDLTIKNDLEENERLYQYLLEQKKFELVEQRAKEKLSDIAKIKECENEIQKIERKLSDIAKIKELRDQLSTTTNTN